MTDGDIDACVGAPEAVQDPASGAVQHSGKEFPMV